MSTITLPNRRVGSDLTVRLKLKDGGLAIDWSTLSRIKAFLYSDAQRAMAGRCDVSVDGDDPTILVCRYASTKMQYLGVNRIIVQCYYMGETKTYDKPALNFVRWTSDQEGEELTIDDPDIDVEIDVEDVTSSILQNILDACIKATEEAKDVVDVQRGPRGYSAYEIAVQDGYEGTEEEWLLSLQGKSAYEIAVELGYEGTEEQWIASLKGEDGKSAYQIAVEHGFVGTEAQWLASLVGPAGKSAYQLAVDQGYEGTLAEWLASLKGDAGDSAYEVAVQEGFVGTKAQWLASLVGPQGLSAYQVAVAEGFEGSVSDWLASLVGPPGDPGITDVSVSVDNNHGTPSATATIVNKLLQLAFHNLKGDPGQSAYALAVALGYTGTEQEWIESLHGADGVGFDDAYTPAVTDGTFIVALSNGDLMTVDLNHTHAQYYSKEVGTSQPQGGFLPDVIYKLGTLTGSVTFALAAAVTGNANHYFIVFDTGSTAPTITWPAGLTWADGSAPTVAASKHYEISIMDGIAAYLEV